MRFGIIIALTPDRSAIGRVLSPLLPASEAMAQVKAAITAGKAPDARFPILQAIEVSSDSVMREHRFRPTADEITAAVAAAQLAATVNGAKSGHVSQITDLNAKLEEADKDIAAAAAEKEQLTARIAELEAQLADKKKK